MPGRPKNNSKTRLANKIGVSVESFQGAHAAKSKNLSKKVEFSRGCPQLAQAVAEHEDASAAFMEHASRENFMWERRAYRAVETLREKLRPISA